MSAGAPQSVPSPSFSPRKLAVAVFRQRRVVLGAFVATLGCVLLATVCMPRTYRSHGLLLVRLGREDMVLDPTATLGQGSVVAATQSRENEINSVAEMLKCQGLTERVVDALGPAVVMGETDYPNQAPAAGSASSPTAWLSLPVTWLRYAWRSVSGTAGLSDRDRAVAALAKRLDIEAARKSNVIDITCQHKSPQLAQAIVQKLIDFYLDEHAHVHRVQGSHRFFDAQAAQLHGELTDLETQLRDLKNRTGVIDHENQQELLVRRIGRVEDELLETGTETAAAEARVRQLQATLAATPKTEVSVQTTGYPDQGTDLMRSQLYNLQMAERLARARLRDDHPRLQEILRQEQESQQILDREERGRTQVTTTQPKVYDESRSALVQQEAAIASLRAKTARLNAEMIALRGQLQTLNENELQIARLEREVELKDASYRKYAANLEQARIDQALEVQRMSNISVAQPATYEPQPVRPVLWLNLALGLVLAVGASLACTLWREWRDPSLRSVEEVEWRLDLPLLATIPQRRTTVLGR